MEKEIQVIEENTEQTIEIEKEPILIGSGEIEITENGIYNVGSYASANVQVPLPTGEIEITQNGIANVYDYATANIQVPQPSGTINITENGVTDITDYASANVNVPGDPNEYFSNVSRWAKPYQTIKKIPFFTLSSGSTANGLFRLYYELQEVENLNIGTTNDARYLFDSCSKLKKVPTFSTSNITMANRMFGFCTELEIIPILDFSRVEYMQNLVQECPNLSNESLNNIMATILSATNYTGTKTLKYIGISQEQATTCQSLSNWSALSNAGWTTGY